MLRTFALFMLIGLSAFAQDSRPTSKPAEPETTLMDRLSEQRISLDVAGLLVSDVLRLLSEQSGANAVLAPSCPSDAKVSLSLKDVSVKDALEILVKSVEPKLAWTVHANAIVHVRKAGTKKLETPKADGKWLETVGQKTIDVMFEDTPLSDVVEFMGVVSGAKLDVEEDLVDATFSAKLSGVPLTVLLDVLAEQVGASWSLHDGVVWIRVLKK